MAKRKTEITAADIPARELPRANAPAVQERMIRILEGKREQMVNRKAEVESRMASNKSLSQKAREAVTKQYDEFIAMYDKKIEELNAAKG